MTTDHDAVTLTADDKRWNVAVDWMLNHRSATDTTPLFFAYVDGLITEQEMRDEVPVDMEPDGVMHRNIYDVINERRVSEEAGQ